ncbi:nucleotide exchange factor GrpE [Synergistes jonesii]|uniref:nucleotide exchange factor GrpE n=1 Tax=Synergistes jonesii TaxID=2754 RepID=UPI003321119A
MDEQRKPNAEEPQATEEVLEAAEEAEQRPSECDELKEEVKKLKEEVARGRADYFNLRTRMERDREINAKLAAEQAVKEMIPVFENLERIADAVTDKESALAKGMAMVIKQFENGLCNLGLEFIPVEGEFDPSLHEAVSMEPVDDASRDGHIIGALCRGYKLAGRVLKAPQVRVGKYSGGQDN